MALTNVGRNALAGLIAGVGTAFDSNTAQIVVGNGATAVVPTQTALQGTSTATSSVDVGFPTVTNNIVTYQATFSTNEANFAWNEWGVTNGTTLLNRKVETLGTKTSAQSWQISVSLTLNHL